MKPASRRASLPGLHKASSRRNNRPQSTQPALPNQEGAIGVVAARLPFIATVALAVLGLALLAACTEAGRRQQVRGQVLEVVARNFSELETLRLRDATGQEYLFTTEGFVGFTPAHVKEHQILGQSLLVTYEKRGNTLVAVSLAD